MLSDSQSRPGVVVDPDETYLFEVLTDCRVRLQSALATAQRYSNATELHQAIGDAFTACEEALTILDEPQLYDLATETTPIQGKVHPPQSAFDGQ